MLRSSHAPASAFPTNASASLGLSESCELNELRQRLLLGRSPLDPPGGAEELPASPASEHDQRRDRVAGALSGPAGVAVGISGCAAGSAGR
jgi:hypothetical protein